MSPAVRFNEAFRPVHECRKRYVVLKGGAGSGKSVDTAQFYILRLMSQPGRNLMCMRKSEYVLEWYDHHSMSKDACIHVDFR